MYLLYVLPSPSKNYFKTVEQLLFEFIWSGKPDKIKRDVMIAPINKGGANMIDIQVQDKAIKIAWITRLVDNNEAAWKILVEQQMPNIITNIWKANIHQNDIEQICPHLNRFWKDVLKSWCELHFYEPQTKKEVLDQILWNNSHIKVANKVIWYQRWERAGIQKVADLLNNDYSFCSLHDILIKYNIKIDFLNYKAITLAIPKTWIIILENGKENNAEIQNIIKRYCIDDINGDKKVSRKVYKILIEKRYLIPWHSFNKWTLDIKNTTQGQGQGDNTINDDLWMDCCDNICQNSESFSIRNFQIKFNNRIIATNHILTKMGILQNSECTFCKKETETLIHLFWNCDLTKVFWDKVLRWLSNITEVDIEFKPEEILIYCPLKDPVPYDFIFTIAKQHIYYCRAKTQIPSLFDFISHINNILKIEYNIAMRRGRESVYKKRWGLLLT